MRHFEIIHLCIESLFQQWPCGFARRFYADLCGFQLFANWQQPQSTRHCICVYQVIYRLYIIHSLFILLVSRDVMLDDKLVVFVLFTTRNKTKLIEKQQRHGISYFTCRLSSTCSQVAQFLVHRQLENVFFIVLRPVWCLRVLFWTDCRRGERWCPMKVSVISLSLFHQTAVRI